jgi:hypothetical protein
MKCSLGATRTLNDLSLRDSLREILWDVTRSHIKHAEASQLKG